MLLEMLSRGRRYTRVLLLCISHLYCMSVPLCTVYCLWGLTPVCVSVRVHVCILCVFVCTYGAYVYV